jgi:hypothetical protein
MNKDTIWKPSRIRGFLLLAQEGLIMHSTEGLHGRPQRRSRVWRIVIVAILAAAIGEPIVMYLSLAREKEQRRTASELSFGVSTARAGDSQAATP